MKHQSVELASRWTRLGSVLIDGVIGVLVAIPYMLVMHPFQYVEPHQPINWSMMLTGAVYGFIGFVVVHYYFLDKYGQTVGKRMLNIRIVDMNGQQLSANTLLLKRFLPLTLVSLIPLLGSLLLMVDALYIFRQDKRCVHDFIAGTQVIKVNNTH